MSKAQKPKGAVNQYPVREIRGPWMDGGGAMSGMPAIVVELGGTRYRSLYQIEEDVKAVQDRMGTSSPAWAAVIGDERYADNNLYLQLKVGRSLKCYTETDGTSPMCPDGRLPMWDHVALRARLPLPSWKLHTQLFHSVVALLPATPAHLETFSGILDRLAFNGQRFVEGPGAPSVAAQLGRNWRASVPTIITEGVKRAKPKARA